MENKKEFVGSKLKPLLMALDEDIEDVFYTTCGNFHESVVVVYKSGFDMQVNVTMDSLTALTKDVLTRL